MSTQPESKHTPGPWERYGYIGKPGLTRVRACTGKDVLGREMFVDLPANEEDARLIAAAPDLLAACWSTIQYLEKRADCESNELWGEVSAAYRKAIGNRDSG